MISHLQQLRQIAELKKQRQALERIATCLEEFLLQSGEKSGLGLRTFYKDKGGEEAGVVDADDAFWAEQERMEEERKKDGGGVEKGWEWEERGDMDL